MKSNAVGAAPEFTGFAPTPPIVHSTFQCLGDGTASRCEQIGEVKRRAAHIHAHISGTAALLLGYLTLHCRGSFSSTDHYSRCSVVPSFTLMFAFPSVWRGDGESPLTSREHVRNASTQETHTRSERKRDAHVCPILLRLHLRSPSSTRMWPLLMLLLRFPARPAFARRRSVIGRVAT